MSRNYVYSTLSNSNRYVAYHDVPAGGQVAEISYEVFIEGGANVATKNLVTPRGVVTEVSDQDVAFLKNHPLFKLHEKGGHVAIDERKVDPEVIVAGRMKQKDDSAPMTPNDDFGSVKPEDKDKKQRG